MPARIPSTTVFRVENPVFCTAACRASPTISDGEDTFIRIAVKAIGPDARSVRIGTVKVSKKRSSAPNPSSDLSTKFCQCPFSGTRLPEKRSRPPCFSTVLSRLVPCLFRPKRPGNAWGGRSRSLGPHRHSLPGGGSRNSRLSGKRSGNFAIFPKSRIFAALTYCRLCIIIKKSKNACKNQISASR